MRRDILPDKYQEGKDDEKMTWEDQFTRVGATRKDMFPKSRGSKIDLEYLEKMGVTDDVCR